MKGSIRASPQARAAQRRHTAVTLSILSMLGYICEAAAMLQPSPPPPGLPEITLLPLEVPPSSLTAIVPSSQPPPASVLAFPGPSTLAAPALLLPPPDSPGAPAPKPPCPPCPPCPVRPTPPVPIAVTPPFPAQARPILELSLPPSPATTTPPAPQMLLRPSSAAALFDSVALQPATQSPSPPPSPAALPLTFLPPSPFPPSPELLQSPPSPSPSNMALPQASLSPPLLSSPMPSPSSPGVVPLQPHALSPFPTAPELLLMLSPPSPVMFPSPTPGILPLTPPSLATTPPSPQLMDSLPVPTPPLSASLLPPVPSSLMLPPPSPTVQSLTLTSPSPPPPSPQQLLLLPTPPSPTPDFKANLSTPSPAGLPAPPGPPSPGQPLPTPPTPGAPLLTPPPPSPLSRNTPPAISHPPPRNPSLMTLQAPPPQVTMTTPRSPPPVDHSPSPSLPPIKPALVPLLAHSPPPGKRPPPPLLTAQAAAARLAAVKSGAVQMFGVNLGSWLVLEQYMVPSIFATVTSSPYGERQLMQFAAQQNLTAKVRSAIIAHRNTWLTQADFAFMASIGINTVRLPVGYWVLAQTQNDTLPGAPYAPFVEGGLAYVDSAFQWGAAHGIGVIIDVHAANGSQNGFDHSAPTVVNGNGQQLWDSRTQPTPSYAAQAVALVATLAARYGASPALLGFSLLNEPTVDNLSTLYGYYQSAYAAVRAYSADCFVVVAPRTWEEDSNPSGSATPASWQTFMAGSGYIKVLLDLHKYETGFNGYGGSSFSTAAQYIAFANTTMLQRLAAFLADGKRNGGIAPIISEWGLAGPPFNCGGGPADSVTAQQVSAFWNAQAQAYLQPGSAGWIMWSLKMEGGGIWSLEDCYNGGYLAHALLPAESQ